MYADLQLNKSCVDLAGATVVDLILKKINRGNKGCTMCTDKITQTRDSPQKFSNVRLAYEIRDYLI